MRKTEEYIRTVTSKGQVTIPAEIRRLLEVDPVGDATSRPSDPITQVAQTVQALGSLEPGGWLQFQPDPEFPGFPQVSIEAIEGDNRASCRCQLDLHVHSIPGQDVETVRNDFERLLDRVGTAAPGLGVELEVPVRDTVSIPPFVGSADTRLFRALRRRHKGLIRQKPVSGAGSFLGQVAGGYWLAQAGSSTVVYGPGNRRDFARWPTANERIWIEDMVLCAAVIALVVRDLGS